MYHTICRGCLFDSSACQSLKQFRRIEKIRRFLYNIPAILAVFSLYKILNKDKLLRRRTHLLQNSNRMQIHRCLSAGYRDVLCTVINDMRVPIVKQYTLLVLTGHTPFLHNATQFFRIIRANQSE